MTYLSIKDFAEERNITYEAVRQQVVRYKSELEGHIVKDGRQQLLDEEAVAFLDSKRQKNPVVIIQQNKDEMIERLRMEKEQLLVKVAAQADELAELAKWKAEKSMMIAEADQTRLALEAANKEKALLEGFIQDAKTEIQTLSDERTQEAVRAREKLEAMEKAMEEEKYLREAAEAELAAYRTLPWYKKIFR